MPFERSLEIERRLDYVLHLIRTGRFSTPMLAEKVGVSIPGTDRKKRANFDRKDGATKAPVTRGRAPVAQLGAL